MSTWAAMVPAAAGRGPRSPLGRRPLAGRRIGDVLASDIDIILRGDDELRRVWRPPKLTTPFSVGPAGVTGPAPIRPNDRCVLAGARHPPECDPSTVRRNHGHALPGVDHPIVRELVGIAAVRVHDPQLATLVVGADLHGALEEDPAPICGVGRIAEIEVVSGRRRHPDGMDVRPGRVHDEQARGTVLVGAEQDLLSHRGPVLERFDVVSGATVWT